jgi:hypothetical protein
MKARRLIVALLALSVAVLTVAAPATAKDRNKDKIPDRWEKKYDLSLQKKQGRRDQDRDGLRNRAEYRAKTSPRSSDSDDDGTDDGDEGAGKIVSYDPGTGELVINLFGGDTVTGLVTDETRIRCGCRGTDDDYGDDDSGDERSLMHGGDSGSGHDEDEEEDHSGPGHDGQGHGGGHGDDRLCTTDELVEGAVVSEAELELTADGLVFDEIELVGANPDGEPDDD